MMDREDEMAFIVLTMTYLIFVCISYKSRYDFHWVTVIYST